MPHYSRFASADVHPARFVKLDSSNPGQVLEATAATDEIFGVSQPGTRYAPWSALDDTLAAKANEVLGVYGPPEIEVLLEIGGTVTLGQWLTATSNGKGLASITDRDKVGAIALEGGVSGDIIRVQLVKNERSTS